jgi:hypothetical protein
MREKSNRILFDAMAFHGYGLPLLFKICKAKQFKLAGTWAVVEFAVNSSLGIKHTAE